MAKGKITGGELSNPILQIPLGKPHVVHFKPDIDAKWSKEETKELLSSLEMLLVKTPVPDKLDYNQCISCKREISGSEVLFTIQVPEPAAKQKKQDTLGVYQCIIAEVERDAAQGGAVVQVKDHLLKMLFEMIQTGNTTQADTSTSESETPVTGSGAMNTDPGFSTSMGVGGFSGGGNPPSGSMAPENGDSGRNDSEPLRVALEATVIKPTPSKSFWKPLKKATEAISFEKYADFINTICEMGDVRKIVKEGDNMDRLSGLARRRFLPFNDTDSYRTIKVLTEFFLLANCTIDLNDPDLQSSGYLKKISGNYVDTLKEEYTIPYLHIIRQRLRDLPIKPRDIGDLLNLFQGVNVNIDGHQTTCYGLLQEKLTKPCGIELIWSYWHEEAMLVQAMNAISLRFQNRKQPGRGGKDPLANMAVAPLLPLNNLLWGYVQDEQHRLSVLRRAYEYDHHYGITLMGKAAPNVEGADSRSNFLHAFHSLLHRCTSFFKQVDDLTVQADGFPILNALRDVHLILSEGAHNQYGDLPWNARVEMLMQQWMLSRPEFREFLPSRTMVAYPEPWMGPLTTMNNMQGWTSNSPINFNTLAVFGERLLLSIRFLWPDLTAEDAANWANDFRNEIQGYIHAYNAVTGVDLTNPHPQTGKIDAQQPAVHLLRRARAGSNGNGQVKTGALAQ